MLKVLYWNVYNRGPLTHLALRARGDYDVIALSELHIDLTSQAPACPATCNYTLIYGGGRLALYIHKRYGPDTWTPRCGPDWAEVTILGTRIITFYSPPGANASETLRPLIDLDPGPPTLLLGDFNLHHLL